MKKRTGSLGGTIGLVIGIVMFVAVMLPVVRSVTDTATDLSYVSSENATAAAGAHTYLLDQATSTPSSIVVKNNAGTTLAASKYALHSNGTLEFLDCTTDGCTNNIDVNYFYQGTGYVTGSTSRTIVSLLPLFVGIAVLVLVAGFAR